MLRQWQLTGLAEGRWCGAAEQSLKTGAAMVVGWGLRLR